MTVLIGYVPTDPGRAALERGLAEARLRGEDVVIVNSPRRGSTVDASMIADDEAADLVARAEALGVTSRVEQPEHGANIQDTFADLVERFDASVVVIGIRRRSPVGKLVLGSDAQRLLLDLPVAILAVKPAA